MKKIGIPLAVISVSTMLLAGCGVNDTNDQNGMTTRSFNNGNHSLLRNGNYRNYDNNRGFFRQLDQTDNNGNGNANANAGGNAGGKKFKDVPTDEWFTENVQWGADMGIIEGFPDGSFQPNKPVTRAEVIKIINTMAERGFFNTPAATPTESPAPTATPTPTPTVEPTVEPTATPDTAGTPAGGTDTTPAT